MLTACIVCCRDDTAGAALGGEPRSSSNMKEIDEEDYLDDNLSDDVSDDEDDVDEDIDDTDL